jgi:hypothetical protein
MKGLKFMSKGLAVAVLAVAMCSCGGSDDDNGPGPGNGISGTWTGSGSFVNPMNGQTTTAPTSLTINQNGTQISGVWDTYAFTGSVNGNAVSITLTPFTDSGVAFTGGGSLTVNGNNMSGALTITGGAGGQSVSITANITVTHAKSAKEGESEEDELVSQIIDAVAGH